MQFKQETMLQKHWLHLWFCIFFEILMDSKQDTGFFKTWYSVAWKITWSRIWVVKLQDNWSMELIIVWIICFEFNKRLCHCDRKNSVRNLRACLVLILAVILRCGVLLYDEIMFTLLAYKQFWKHCLFAHKENCSFNILKVVFLISYFIQTILTCQQLQ